MKFLTLDIEKYLEKEKEEQQQGNAVEPFLSCKKSKGCVS